MYPIYTLYILYNLCALAVSCDKHRRKTATLALTMTSMAALAGHVCPLPDGSLWGVWGVWGVWVCVIICMCLCVAVSVCISVFCIRQSQSVSLAHPCVLSASVTQGTQYRLGIWGRCLQKSLLISPVLSRQHHVVSVRRYAAHFLQFYCCL